MKSSSSNNIKSLLDSLNISRGNNLVCHSFTPSIAKSKEDILVFIELVLERIGPEGTLCAPSFTYSGMRGEIFNPEKSKSKVGVLSDVLLSFPEAKRSVDANFSWVCIGGHADYFTLMDTAESFGENSFFDKLLKKSGKAFLVGVDFDSLPFFMFLEKKLKVPYRYNKAFSSEVDLGGEIITKEFIHFVRCLERDVICDRLKIGAFIEKQNDFYSSSLPRGMAKVVSLKTIENVVFKKYQEDKNILIKTN